MTDSAFYNTLLALWFILAVIMFMVLFFVSAPYGRHIRAGWGPTIPDRTGWIVMESPAVVVFTVCFVLADHNDTIPALTFLAAWLIHYVYRAFIYPLRLRGSHKRMPLSVVSMGFLFNVVNGYLNGCYLFTLSGGYPNRWLIAPQFLMGMALFVVGIIINRRSDRILRELRQPGESVYKIPQGGLYRWISCPNYFGEIVEWTGWAIATWSLAGLAFAVWTVANLAPRARANHAWYRQRFPDYPTERRALIPSLW